MAEAAEFAEKEAAEVEAEVEAEAEAGAETAEAGAVSAEAAKAAFKLASEAKAAAELAEAEEKECYMVEEAAKKALAKARDFAAQKVAEANLAKTMMQSAINDSLKADEELSKAESAAAAWAKELESAKGSRSFFLSKKSADSTIAATFASWHMATFGDKIQDIHEAAVSDDEDYEDEEIDDNDDGKIHDDDEKEKGADKLPLLFSDYVVPADCAFDDFKLPNSDLGMNYRNKLPLRLQKIEYKIIEMTKKDFNFTFETDMIDENVMIAKAKMDAAAETLTKAEFALRFVSDKHAKQIAMRELVSGFIGEDEMMWHAVLYDMTRVFYKRRNMYWAAAENYYKAKSDKWKATCGLKVPKVMRLGFPQMM
jgi:hypothetical protein